MPKPSDPSVFDELRQRSSELYEPPEVWLVRRQRGDRAVVVLGTTNDPEVIAVVYERTREDGLWKDEPTGAWKDRPSETLTVILPDEE